MTDVRAGEIAAEQRYLDRVYARLEELRANAAEVRAEGFRRSQAGPSGGLVERDVFVYQAARRLRELDAEYEGLVFGRLDLAGGEVRYIGRLGLRDAAYESMVVDWRAPAAAPFYQATPEDPMGVVRRRIIRSSGPTVIALEDDLLDPAAAPADMAVIGDGALLASLARARGRAMKDIVATIQREQDLAIRAPGSGATMITGGPGTGKTAVALHRIAYLLYADRRRFEGGGVLLVGPSTVFMRYIAQVLPSLGEDTVDLRAVGGVVDDLTGVGHDPAASAAVKGDIRIRRVLSRAVRDAPTDAPTSLRIVYGGEVIKLDEAALRRARRMVFGRASMPNPAVPQARETLLTALWETAMAWADPPSHWRREIFDREVADRTEFIRFLRAWWPVLTPAEVLGWLRDPDRLHRYARDILDPGALTFADKPTIEDVPLLDELRILLGDPPPPPRRNRRSAVPELTTIAERQFAPRARFERPDHYDEYAHVVVDESQDLSPMQWRMLGRRGKYASWTIVGDPAQAAWTDTAEADRAREAALGTRQRRDFHLTTNYRNTAEIFEYAAVVLRRAMPDADLPAAVRTTGEHPVEIHAHDLAEATGKAVGDLLVAVEGTVGVVAPDPAPLAHLAGGRVQVVDPLEAKGLEYDGVVVVDPDTIAGGTDTGIRTLYVALTRATQRLTVVKSE